MLKKALTILFILTAVMALASCAPKSDEKYFVVTFCGEFITTNTEKVPEGGFVSVPDAPVVNGYRFLYWIDEKGKKFEFDEPITDDITLFATWEHIPAHSAEKFTVRFFGADGKQIGADQLVAKGHSAKAPALAPEEFFLFEWDTNFEYVTSDLDVYAVKQYDAASTDLFSFELKDGTYEITGIAPYAELPHMSNGYVKLALPEKYRNIPITSVGDGAFENKNIYSLYIPSCYKTIGKDAFRANPRLSNVVFNEGLTNIGDGAFMASDKIAVFTDCAHSGSPAYASAISSLSFPSTLVSIGERAFYMIGRLCENVYTEIPVKADFGKCANLEYIGDSAFEGVEFISLDLSGIKADLHIGNYAFAADTYINWVRFDSMQYPRSSLTSLKLPVSTKYIGECAFYGHGNNFSLYNGTLVNNKQTVTFDCPSLKLDYIGTGAFYNVALRGRLKIAATQICDYAFYGHELSYVGLSGVATIGKYAFIGTSNALPLELDLGNSLVAIGDGAFYGNAGLTSIAFPDTLVTVGNYAFDGCLSLSGEVVFPASCSTVGASAFARTAIETAEFKGSTTLKKQCFAQCLSLKEAIGGISVFGEGVFYGCKALVKVDLPQDMRSIPNELFYECESLTSIALPNLIERIGKNAFYHCTMLDSVVIPSEVVVIDQSAFQSCYAIKSVSFAGEKLTDINEFAFGFCRSLKRIELPRSVARIGDYAFAGTGLTEFTTPAALTTMGYGVFYRQEYTIVRQDENGNSVTEKVKMPVLDAITIGKDTGEITFDERGTFYGSAILGFDVESGNEFYSSLNGILYSANRKKLIMYIRSETLTHIELAEGLEEIESGAFMNSVGLESVVLPSSLLSIGDYAFYNCPSLGSITLPSEVLSIGDYAFAGKEDAYSSLGKIDFNEKIDSIGKYAFANNSALGEIVIPSSLASIGNRAFYNCSALRKIDLEGASGLSIIGEWAFGGDSYSTAPKIVSIDFTHCDSLRETGAYAFSKCSELIDITMGGLTKIGMGSFADCVGIETVEIGASVVDIDAYAFSRCTGLAEIVVPKQNSLRNIMPYAFAGSIRNKMTYSVIDLTNATQLGSVGEGAFAYGTLTTAIMPASSYSLGDEAFDRCEFLTDVDLGDAYAIGENVFRRCGKLKTLDIPSSVTTIAKDAFCELSLELVNIGSPEEGNNISYLGKNAFFNCRMLKTVNIYGKNVPRLAGNEYNLSFHCSDDDGKLSVLQGLSIMVDNGIKNAYLDSAQNSSGWSVYAAIIFEREESSATLFLPTL